jgi:hypothetical protein
MSVVGFPEHDTIEDAIAEHFSNLTDEQRTTLINEAKSEFEKLEKLEIEITDKLAVDTYNLLVEKLFSDEITEETEQTDEGVAEDTTPTDDTEVVVEQMIKNTKKHSLSHSFQWALPLELGENSAEELMLIKGVAMRAGEMKRGERMSAENLNFAAGAMSAAAMFGLVPLNIDHYQDKLPEKYEEQYGKEINDPYPIGLVLDAAVSENISEHDGKKYTEVEFIGSITNPFVYDMIKRGMFKGGSVVDYYRKETCDCGADQTHDVCNQCDIEGSHFLEHTLILDEVPNSNGTWVAAVDEKDIGTIIAKPTESRMTEMKKDLKNNIKAQAIMRFIKQAQKKHAVYELETYMNEDGTWKDGKSSIAAFLKEEKGLADVTAADMAEYLWTHPEALTQYQYENMSAEDLVAWFMHIQMMAFQAKLNQLAKQQAAIAGLRHNADGLAVLKNLKQLTAEEVNLTDGAENPCMNCRWFLALDDTNREGEGICAIVEGDLTGTMGCDRFESAGEEESPEDGEDLADETTEDVPEENAEVPMLEDGSCPEGYVPNAEGTACVIPQAVRPQTVKRNVSIDKNAKPSLKEKLDINQTLRNEIAEDEKKLKAMKVLNTKQHAEYMSLKSKIQKKKHTLRYGD